MAYQTEISTVRFLSNTKYKEYHANTANVFQMIII